MHSPVDAQQPSAFFCNYCNATVQSQASISVHLRETHHIDCDTDMKNADLQQTHKDGPANSCLSEQKIMIGNNFVPENQSRETSADDPTSKTKDFKKHKVQTQTQPITKFFSPVSESDVNSSVTSAHCSENTKATLILQETTAGLSSSGVLKVTAKSVIDMSATNPYCYLMNDDLSGADSRSATPVDELKNTQIDKQSVKRPYGECPHSLPEKKTKLQVDEPPATSSNVLSEISEDEDDMKASLVNGDANVYRCKHCKYSNNDISRTLAHYQNDHPYIRHNTIYIEDPRDRSATFRCLECPIEFSSEAKLKRHYEEKHPQAPEAFKMHSHELVHRCLICPVITNEVCPLKDHYKEQHPEQNLDNPLIFCRYSSTSHVKAGINEHSPKKTEEYSIKNTKRELNKVDNPLFTPSRTHRDVETIFYNCTKCTFSHKSAVALHVHYQKYHPDEAVTINKIKQSASVTPNSSQMMSHMPLSSPATTSHTSQSSLMATENLPSQKMACNSSTKTAGKTEQSKQKVLMSLMKLKQTLVISKTSQSSKREGTVSTVDREETKAPPTKNTDLSSARTESSLPNSSDKVFHCQVCNYFSVSVKSVVAHHNTKHAMLGLTGAEEVVLYNAKFQKMKTQHDSEAPEHSASSESETSHRMTTCAETKEVLNLYDYPENLFYCHKCNFANLSLKGVLNHQSIVHNRNKANRENVIEHTSTVREQIQKSKSETKESPLSSYLPLPLMNEGDEERLFCHFCNFRNKSMSKVLSHYSDRHHSPVKAESITEYTTALLTKVQMSQRIQGNPESNHEKTNKKQVDKMEEKAAVSEAEPQKTLQCPRCVYSCQQLIMLRRHMWRSHHSNRSSTDLLRACFRKGLIESGYHCDSCMFSHSKAKVVYKHFKQNHPERKLTLHDVSSRFYAGSDMAPSKKTKPKTKDIADVCVDDCDNADGQSLSQKTKMFSCRACSFKGDSMLSITRHCRAVHPWSVKDDGSIPNVISSNKATATNHVADDHQYMAIVQFEDNQTELKAENPPESSHKGTEMVRCLHCPAEFTSQRGLNTHCGLKHQDKMVRNKRRVHVFKCPYCTYVNNNYQGVTTHCQMRHPDSPSRADSLHVDAVYLHKEGCTGKGPKDSLRLRGYMCQRCPQICVSHEKLEKHLENNECQTRNALHTTSAARKKLPLTALSSMSKASFLCKKKYSKVKCQHCSYVCTTKFALSRHMQVQHRDNPSYQCNLCPSSYCGKKRLAHHYTKAHGKDAFDKHFAALYTESTELSPKSPDHPLTQQMHQPSEAAVIDEEKIIFYKCPRCRYINTRPHGTLTHCQMRHPSIVVRTDTLTTVEVPQSNLVKCSKGKGSSKRGYMCRKCPQIYKTLYQVKSHNKADHGSLSSGIKLPDPSETEISSECSAAESEDVSADLSHHNPDAAPSTQPVKQGLYKCRLCGYAGLCRKYLQCHYRHVHKLDTASTYKMLEDYNKRKRYFERFDDISSLECKVCPNVAFDTAPLLIAHYAEFHWDESKLDFTVLSKKSGVFKCCHCRKRLGGIEKLRIHLDRHRARRRREAAELREMTEKTDIEDDRQNDLPMCEPETPSKTLILPASPPPPLLPLPPQQPSPQPLLADGPQPPLADGPQPESEESDHKHKCGQCGHSFMSLKGLRSHERGHAAMAAIKNLNRLSSSVQKLNIDEYFIHKQGTMRPFVCSLCPFRTTVMPFWRSHFMKKHQDIIMGDAKTDTKTGVEENTTDQNPDDSEENVDLPDAEEEAEADNSMYLEPPDVRRQLRHYSSMAQRGDGSKANMTTDNLLHCEFCSFNTGHLSSIRRHYLNRHGKKMFRCKDCDYFTCQRKNLELHLESGHMTRSSECVQQKELRCPFCLYQSINKNHMIDHIMLHREERVVPIELRRPKLSRYLQGVVFRCHKCTFSCGSASSLQAHMTRHDDVRPYRCRLCFFDCALLGQLEAHLSHKHQVVRNHELVGQVALDQMDLGLGRTEEEEETEPSSDSERHVSETDDIKVQFNSDPDGAVTSAENETKNPPLMKEVDLKNEERMSSPDIKIHAVKSITAGVHSEDSETGDEDSSAFRLQTEVAAGSGKFNLRTRLQRTLNDETVVKMEHLAAADNSILKLPVNLDMTKSHVELKVSPSDCGDVCKQEEDCDLINRKTIMDGYRDMPVLENEYLKKAPLPLRCVKEENEEKDGGNSEDKDDQVQNQEEGGENMKEDDSSTHRCEIECPSLAEDKGFVCSLCGRKLASVCELQGHISRHGI